MDNALKIITDLWFFIIITIMVIYVEYKINKLDKENNRYGE